jgi:hypothetical protein
MKLTLSAWAGYVAGLLSMAALGLLVWRSAQPADDDEAE